MNDYRYGRMKNGKKYIVYCKLPDDENFEFMDKRMDKIVILMNQICKVMAGEDEKD